VSPKTINWGKLASISFVATFACAAIGWSVDKAIEYAPLPGQVTDHERRISALEAQSATNAVRLDDRLRDIDRDLRVIFKRMDQIGAMSDMNVMSAGSVTNAEQPKGWTPNTMSER
jgi:hypothetical protein